MEHCAKWLLSADESKNVQKTTAVIGKQNQLKCLFQRYITCYIKQTWAKYLAAFYA